jgi:pyrimidine-specific ribonucleoside hydrolase
MLLSLVVAVAACGPPTTPPVGPESPSPIGSAQAGRRAILVDTDVAPDDVMAIAYLVALPDIDLVAVTVSGTGEARCPDGVRLVRGVLERLGRPDVPVACGRDMPLVGDHAFPAAWRDAVADDFRLDLPEPTGQVVDIDAPTLIGRAASEADGSLHILTLGPLTNLADAFTAQPGLAGKIAGVTVMGGAVRTDGNVGDPDGDGTSVDAEWNAHIDPRALAIVLDAGAPVTLVPLDATDAVPMTPEVAAEIEANHGTEAAELVHELLSRNPERIGGTSLWDQTAAILLAGGADGLTLEPLRVAVIETEGPESGRTITTDGGAETTVATAADPSIVVRRFVDGLNGRP